MKKVTLWLNFFSKSVSNWTGIQDDYPVGRYWEKSVKEIKTIVLSEHIDQLWGVDDEGLLMYLPQVSASKRGCKEYMSLHV